MDQQRPKEMDNEAKTKSASFDKKETEVIEVELNEGIFPANDRVVRKYYQVSIESSSGYLENC